MNKMMKLLLVAEGCTLATMACEPGHWYVGGGVGMTYTTARPKVKKVQITEGDTFVTGARVSEQGTYNEVQVSAERDASNAAIAQHRNYKWNPKVTIGGGYTRDFGRLNLETMASIELGMGTTRLKTDTEASNGRDDAQINPPSEYGRIRAPLAVSLLLAPGLKVGNNFNINPMVGFKLIKIRTKMKQSIDTGQGIEDETQPNIHEILQAASKRYLAKTNWKVTPTIGVKLKTQINNRYALSIIYDYCRYNAKSPHNALLMNGNPTIKIREHGLKAMITIDI